MGSSSSKFRKHLQNGDEYAALQLYYSSSDLRKGLDPNCSYGDTYSHDTPLHFASRHAMKSLLRVFLNELGGNPNKKNARNETTLLCVCMVTNARLNYAIQQRRLECLSLVLQWRGATLENGEVERVDLSAQDEKMNTCLHYAASSGLKRCVELLVSQNAPMFIENLQKQTPCDCAEQNSHSEIALYLESKMVFHNEDENTDELDNLLDEMETEEGYSGLRAQDLQEAKDQLLVETSDMLHVPLFTAEALLRNHEWSREMLLEAWMDNAVACCEKCGVVPPSSLFDDRPSTSSQITAPIVSQVEHDLRTPTHTVPPSSDAICDICACMISASEEPVHMLCDHQFCRSCWGRYLTVKISEGEAHNITCPGFECTKLVPVEIIETLVSRDMARRYLQFDIKAFVESNPSIKWCPYPGCGRAVRLPDADNPLSPTFRGMNDMTNTKDTSHSVDCGNGHMFCWECIGEAHEPASCENWTAWHKKIAEIKPEEMNGTEEETEMAANCLWLVTNSKPCPNCKSPIQKNEGCNHMKCSKCKHDFCWVCLEGWKKHSSATGGYFRCNRYEAVKRVEDGQDQAKNKAECTNKKMQELNRFVHYYTRFKNHENSFKLEEPLLNTAKDKMMVLAKAVTDPETANLETKFVEDAVVQILKARRVLKCSYVYGFYLDDSGYKKPIFEFMQTELEECTETLSEMVARPYLRTPRTKIIQTAHLVQRKRQEFVTAIAKGLVPPDSSPTMKRKRKKFSVEVDDDLRKALMASMHDLDPSNPWVKDPSGKHTNVSALLDWPEESDESEGENSPTANRKANLAAKAPPITTEVGIPLEGVELVLEEEESQEELGQAEAPELCARSGCDKTRVINPRTGELHEHCSMKCMRLDRMERVDGGKLDQNREFFTDYQMDLLRALEMSRLQFLQEMGSLRPGSGDRSPRSPVASSSRQSTDFVFDRSPRGSSPLPRSPHLGRSPVTESDLFVPSIVLCDPPRGKNRPMKREEGQETDVIGPEEEQEDALIGDFDGELEQALRLSHIVEQDDDQDLRLAIELSLKDSTSSEHQIGLTKGSSPSHYPPPPRSAPPCSLGAMETSTEHVGTRSPSCEGHYLLGSEYSSIVTRVPNKSIEDLAVDESHRLPYHASPFRSPAEHAPAHEERLETTSPRQGSLHPNQSYTPHRGPDCSQSRNHGPRYHFLDSKWNPSPGLPSRRPSSGRLSPRQQANPFGIMKDISLNNIVASDTDKVKGFSDKDFSQVFIKKNMCDADIEAVVFEPRPSPSATRHPRWQLSYPTRHWTKPLDYTFDSGEDPWLRQTDLQNLRRASSPGPRSSGSGSRSGRLSPRPGDQRPGSSRDIPTQLQTTSALSKPLAAPRLSHTSSNGSRAPAAPPSPVSHQPNPEESLDNALQNLSDLTRNLTREDSLDSVDMVIDSKVLESLLQGAEGYAKEGHEPPSSSQHQGSMVVSDTELERILESAPLVPHHLEDRLPTPPGAESIPLVLHTSQTEPGDTHGGHGEERDAVYV